MNPRDKFFNRVSQNFSSEHLDLINDLWHASGLDEALRRRSVGTLAKFQPCGCVICTCEDDEQCHGCGARMCGTHPGKPIPNPVYESQQAVGVDEAMVRDAARYRLLKSRTKIFEHYFVVDYLESDDADARVDVLIGVDALRHATATLRQSADSGRVGEDLQKWFNGAPRWSYIKVPNVGKELVEREEAEKRIAALEAALAARGDA